MVTVDIGTGCYSAWLGCHASACVRFAHIHALGVQVCDDCCTIALSMHQTFVRACVSEFHTLFSFDSDLN